MRTFSGAWPALVTPFTGDNQVNVPVLKTLTEHLIEKQVGGFYLCGSTGQGLFMSVAERKLVVETVLTQVDGRAPIIVHIGSPVLPDAIDLARHAQAVGVDGVSSVLPPFYDDRQSLFQYFATLAGATPDLPFLPYIFGAKTNATVLMQMLLDIPNVAGTKYTGPNMYEFRHIVEMKQDGWTVFSGMDEQCIFAAMWGASGNIGSTLNLMPGIYREIGALCQAGDFARAQDLQLQVNRVTASLIGSGFMGSLYAALGFLGFDCGQPRLPAPSLPSSQKQALQTALDAVNFLEMATM